MRYRAPRNGKQAGRKWHQLATRFKARCQAAKLPCHHCHQPIDYTLKKPNPGAFEADHKHPVSTHPHLLYEEMNLLPSHARCNNSRGNTPLTTTGHWVQPNW